MNGLVDDKTLTCLENDINIIAFDWKKLAKYSFLVATICIIISLNAIFFNKALWNFFNSPYTLSILSVILYWTGYKRQKSKPECMFSNEIIMFLGVITTAMDIYKLGTMFYLIDHYFSILILLSCVIYGVLGFYLHSNLIWVFALLSLGGWMGAETSYLSGGGVYYLGMNYPLRFVLFGGCLTGLALVFENHKRFSSFFRSTLAVGLLYLFISTWIMSIFGNHGEISSWNKVKQIELFHWSILFGLLSAVSIYHGLRYDNRMTRGFGITFLFINLYTRFFEFFWDITDKALFFGMLGASFWLIGSKAEKIWRFGEKSK